MPLIKSILTIFCFASSFALFIADITSPALPWPIPTCPLPSPITTKAPKRKFLPRDVTLATRVTLITFSSCKSNSAGLIINSQFLKF